MSDVTIVVLKDGPLRVKGPVRLEDSEGNVYESKEAFSLCRCGHSSKKPFCDGTHRSEGFCHTAQAVQA